MSAQRTVSFRPPLALVFMTSLAACRVDVYHCSSESIPIENQATDFELTSKHKTFIYNTLNELKTQVDLGVLFCDIDAIDVVDEVNDGIASYNGISRTIRIEKAQLTDMSFFDKTIIAHEVGHHLQNRLSNDESQEFCDISWQTDGTTPLVSDSSAYLDTDQHSGEQSDTPYGMTNCSEDFAVIFENHAFAHSYLHGFDNPCVVAKATFDDKYFPRQDATLTWSQVWTADEYLVAQYQPDDVHLDEEGRAWIGLEYDTDTLFWLYSDHNGAVAGTSLAYDLIDTERIGNGRFIREFQITEIYFDFYDCDSTIACAQATLRQTDVLSGLYTESAFSVDPGTFEALAYDPQRNDVYFELNADLWVYHVNKGQGQPLETGEDWQASVTSTLVLEDKVVFLNKLDETLYIYDPASATFTQRVIPQYSSFEYLFPLENDTVLVLGETGAEASYEGFIFDPKRDTFEPVLTNLTPNQLSDATEFHYDQDSETMQIILSGTQMESYRLSRNGAVYDYIPSHPDENLAISIGKLEAQNTSTANTKQTLSPDGETFYLMTYSAEGGYVELYTAESSQVTPTFTLPDGISDLYRPSYAWLGDQLLGEYTLNDDGLEHFYETDFEAFTLNEIGVYDLGSYEMFNVSYGDYVLGRSINDTATVINGLDPYTGDYFELAPLPVPDPDVKGLLRDEDTLYILLPNWLLTYDLTSGTYVNSEPVDYPSLSVNFMLIDGRPFVIGMQVEGEEAALRFYASDLGNHAAWQAIETASSDDYYTFILGSADQLWAFPNGDYSVSSYALTIDD